MVRNTKEFRAAVNTGWLDVADYGHVVDSGWGERLSPQPLSTTKIAVKSSKLLVYQQFTTFHCDFSSESS